MQEAYLQKFRERERREREREETERRAEPAHTKALTKPLKQALHLYLQFQFRTKPLSV
jgi:hypothetical protein